MQGGSIKYYHQGEPEPGKLVNVLGPQYKKGLVNCVPLSVHSTLHNPNTQTNKKKTIATMRITLLALAAVAILAQQALAEPSIPIPGCLETFKIPSTYLQETKQNMR